MDVAEIEEELLLFLFFFILLKVEEFVEEIISLFMDLSLRIEIVLKRGIKV